MNKLKIKRKSDAITDLITLFIPKRSENSNADNH